MRAAGGRAWRWALGWPLRAAVLGLLVAALFAGLGAAGSAHARTEMLAVGAEMLRIPGSPTARREPERVLFNGAELRVSRGTTDRSVGELLAAAERTCAGVAPGAERAAGPPAGSADARPGAAFRGGDGGRGFVACLDPALDPERGLLDRLGGKAAGDSMPLPIAYVYAERRGDSTHFIGFQGAQPVDLRAMFPRDADAPGRDPAALPRPASSRRALSLRIAGQPYDAVVYLDRERGLDDLVAHYQGALPGAGWAVVARWRVEEGPGPRQASVVIERAGVLALLIVAQDRAETSTTFLSMEANREQ